MLCLFIYFVAWCGLIKRIMQAKWNAQFETSNCSLAWSVHWQSSLKLEWTNFSTSDEYVSVFHKMSSWVLLVVAAVFHMKLVEYLIKQKAIICISNNTSHMRGEEKHKNHPLRM